MLFVPLSHGLIGGRGTLPAGGLHTHLIDVALGDAPCVRRIRRNSSAIQGFCPVIVDENVMPDFLRPVGLAQLLRFLVKCAAFYVTFDSLHGRHA